MSTQKTVLLAMDFQEGIAGRFSSDVAERAAQAVEAARAADIPVMFVRVAFRPGFPEVADSNRMFAAVRDAGSEGMLEGNPGTELLPALDRRDDEPLITKRRFSAFAGSDLQELLRGAGAEKLVLCGVSTSGVVLSTFRQALDLDYEMTVLSDACADSNSASHEALMNHIFAAHATVLTVDEWAASLR